MVYPLNLCQPEPSHFLQVTENDPLPLHFRQVAENVPLQPIKAIALTFICPDLLCRETSLL